jgi:hypothetical protein
VKGTPMEEPASTAEKVVVGVVETVGAELRRSRERGGKRCGVEGTVEEDLEALAGTQRACPDRRHRPKGRLPARRRIHRQGLRQLASAATTDTVLLAGRDRGGRCRRHGLIRTPSSRLQPLPQGFRGGAGRPPSSPTAASFTP